jgi:hypothetical protein
MLCPGARNVAFEVMATLVALKLLSPNAGAAAELTSCVSGAEPWWLGVALACMPSEATSPPETASTAEALTAGVALVETAWLNAVSGVFARAGER